MPLFGHFGDDAIYMECAQSLAAGSGYRIAGLPGRPFQTKYPPLWPAALSVLWRINPHFPDNLALATLVGWAAIPPYLALAWLTFLRWGMGRSAAWLLVFVLACNGVVLLFSTLVMADLWFSVALLACLSCAESTRGNRWALLAGVLAGAAYLIKSSALPLLISLPLCYALRRRYRCAVLAALPMLAAVAGWNFWAHLHAAHATDLVSMYYTSYFEFYRLGMNWPNFLHMLAVNLGQLYVGLSNLCMLQAGTSLLSDALSVFVLLAAISGVARLVLRSGRLHYSVFALGYISELVLWNFPPTSRLLLPVLVLLLAGVATEAGHALRALHGLSLVTLGLLGPLVFFWGISTYGAIFHGLPDTLAANRRATAGRRAAYDWIRTSTPPSATFLANDDAMLYLYTGRTAASLIVPPMLSYRGEEGPLQDHLRTLPAYARRHHLDYVLLTAGDLARENLERFRPLLTETMNQADGFVRVYHSPEAGIYASR